MSYINDGARSGLLKSPYFMGSLLSPFSDWLLSLRISHCYWWRGVFVVCHWAVAVAAAAAAAAKIHNLMA